MLLLIEFRLARVFVYNKWRLPWKMKRQSDIEKSVSTVCTLELLELPGH